MCVGRRRPKPPQMPDREPADSAIEMTADRVVIGDKRKTSPRQKSKIATKVTRKRFGTRSLQIPLLTGSTSSGSLNYTP